MKSGLPSAEEDKEEGVNHKEHRHAEHVQL
jgi:hypothetical protein